MAAHATQSPSRRADGSTRCPTTSCKPIPEGRALHPRAWAGPPGGWSRDRPVRRRSSTTGPPMRLADRLVLSALTVDGLIVGILSVTFLNVYAGSVPVPVTAVIGALLVAWFVRIATSLTASAVRYGPMLARLVPVLAGLSGGPGGDVLLYADWRTLLLVVLGVGAPVVHVGGCGGDPRAAVPAMAHDRGGDEHPRRHTPPTRRSAYPSPPSRRRPRRAPRADTGRDAPVRCDAPATVPHREPRRGDRAVGRPRDDLNRPVRLRARVRDAGLAGETAPARSPIHARCSSRSPGCAATDATTAPSSPSRASSPARGRAPISDGRDPRHRASRRRTRLQGGAVHPGDRPEDRWPEAAQWLDERGYDHDPRLRARCVDPVLEETGSAAAPQPRRHELGGDLAPQACRAVDGDDARDVLATVVHRQG